MSATVFQIPEHIYIEQQDAFRGIFTFKPLEKGYGLTIGNALRRVLLSSLEGYAITSIRLPGVQHEFSTIEGVIENVVEIILNLKQVRFKKIGDNTADKILLSVSSKKVLKAGAITKATSSFEVSNPELVICNMDESARLELEIMVEQGKGYVPAEENKLDNQVKDLIPIDAIFTPIKNVKYHVENTRVGQKTDYDSLVLEIQTDGTIYPQDALARAALIMIKHFSLFVDKSKLVEVSNPQDAASANYSIYQMRKLLRTPLSEMQLSSRALNCLKAADITTLGHLVQLNTADMTKLKNFGEKSLQELQELVASKNLTFGMDVSTYNL
ncbi:MAG: DNA-directed RNA polymerase subunit alpha [Bacteroidota bacterium]